MICRLKMEYSPAVDSSEMTAAAISTSDPKENDAIRVMGNDGTKVGEGSAPPLDSSVTATTTDSTVSPHYFKRYHGGPKVNLRLYLYQSLLKTTNDIPFQLLTPTTR